MNLDTIAAGAYIGATMWALIISGFVFIFRGTDAAFDALVMLWVGGMVLVTILIGVLAVVSRL